jgi:hypothetical protein
MDGLVKQSASAEALHHLAGAGGVNAEPNAEAALVDPGVVVRSGEQGVFDRVQVLWVEDFGADAKADLVEAACEMRWDAMAREHSTGLV